jgi:hypothetical protein
VNNLVRFRVLLVVSILAVLINSASILLALIQEVEFYYGCAGCISLTAYKPVVGTLSLACYSDIFGWLCLQILGVVPVASYVADELEGIIVLLIMCRKAVTLPTLILQQPASRSSRRW